MGVVVVAGVFKEALLLSNEFFLSHAMVIVHALRVPLLFLLAALSPDFLVDDFLRLLLTQLYLLAFLEP